MDFQKLKNTIYSCSGLRDIYVENIDITDWRKWIEFVNKNYEVDFLYGINSIEKNIENKINENLVFDFWNGENELFLKAIIKVGTVNVYCNFFDENEIENDVSPHEITTIEDHNLLIEYLKSVSKILNKRALVCQENYSDKKIILIEVDNDFVKYFNENLCR